MRSILEKLRSTEIRRMMEDEETITEIIFKKREN